MAPHQGRTISEARAGSEYSGSAEHDVLLQGSGLKKRKRASAEADNSSASGEVDGNGNMNGPSGERARPSPMKRACNECRQQKLRCDVQVDPYKDCSRCRRLNLACRIDANFRRVGKRSRNAEMEKEIQDLRKRIADKEGPQAAQSSPNNTHILAQDPLTALHQGAAGSLLDLRNSNSTSTPRGRPESKPTDVRNLGNIYLTPDRIGDLFEKYFTFYHPFMPVLDPDKPWEQYFDLSPLLFWTIISVAARRCSEDPTLLTGVASPLSTLIWSTVSHVPQNYHVVKAFCLLCTWPLPTKSTSTDPTFMLAGLMMQIALQTGLHRPSHVQDFSRIRVELRDEDIRDRLKTWASCNIVSQAISTGHGQPPKSIYDWTLTSLPEPDGTDFTNLPPDLYWRLQIERFCNKISQKFYNNRTDSIGITSDAERAAWNSVLVEEYQDLERRMSSQNDPILSLHLLAANLHLRLSAFFDSPRAPNYKHDLLELYFATKRFLTSALELNTAPPTSSSPNHTANNVTNGSTNLFFSPTLSSTQSPFASASIPSDQPTLTHVGAYIMQMLLAGGFTLMKLLNSFFARHIDPAEARRLFNANIRAIRAISVANNDLPGRLAEVLAQLWRSSSASLSSSAQQQHQHLRQDATLDGSLQLKVRCRMSMSLLFDSVWRWREEFQFKPDGGAAALAALEVPTDPEGPASSSSPSGDAIMSQAPQHLHLPSAATTAPVTELQQSLAATPGAVGDFTSGGGGGMMGADATLPSASMAPSELGGPPSAYGGVGTLGSGGIGDLNYEVFDPLTWMLDGEIDFPYDGAGAGGGVNDGLFG